MKQGLTALGLTLATTSMMVGVPVASAQSADDMFGRSRNVAVQARPRPDYEAAGIRAGAFMAYPKVDLTAEYNDNIYARATEVSDYIFRIAPELVLDSNWNQHFLTMYVRGAADRYADNEDENTEEYSLGASGRLDVTRELNVAAGADYINTFEPRSAPNAPDNAVSPVEYDLTQAYISATRTAGRIRLSARLDGKGYDYSDGRNGAGGVIDQDYRDRDVVTATGRIEYAVSPDTAVFFQSIGNERDYDLDSPVQRERDSKGYELLAGANFEVSNLVRGEIAAGYIEQNYERGVYEDVDGFSAKAQLEWFVSEITTVNASAGRSVEDAANPGAGGMLLTSASIGVDHELLRNVVLNGRLTYADMDYRGIDRTDESVGASIGATYLLNRNVGINATLSTAKTESAGLQADDDYTINRLALTLVTQF
jgi:hypothetical protein